MRTTVNSILAATLVTGALVGIPRPAHAGPPWISIELPANPYERATRNAFLLVHAFHHGTPVGFPVSGTAEGIVNGERRSVILAFDETSRPGVYALRNQWGTEGEWTLVITVRQGGDDDVAQAMVQISRNTVFAVRVPTTEQDGWTIPRRISRAEVERSLEGRAARVVRNER
jgi:hypothetical protein